MLTTEQLNAIKERAEKATAGPWGANDGVVVTLSIRDRKYNEPEDIAEMSYDFENDAEFIAHAREDIPTLLKTVEALSAILAEKEETRDKIAKDWSNLLDERNALIAEVERLRKELEFRQKVIEIIARDTQCDDTWDFANRIKSGMQPLTLSYRIGGGVDD